MTTLEKERPRRSQWLPPENDQFAQELFLTGERPDAGVYRQVGCVRTVVLEEGDALPADVDGGVACYLRGWPRS